MLTQICDNVPVNCSVELGRATIKVKDLSELNLGSVIELNKLAGEPMDLYVNGMLIGRGEAVVVNEKFGIRMTALIQPLEVAMAKEKVEETPINS